MNKYRRKINKSLIPTCNILGVNIAAINMEWLIKYLNENLDYIKGDYICVANVHTTVTSYNDPSYCDIQNGALMAIPDGGPLSSVGHKRGYRNMKRTTGPSLMEEIFKISEKKGYRHYFYGSTKETLKKLYQNINHDYPNINIVGMYSPPFREITYDEDKIIVEQINKTKPDYVWVGLGAPKQEIWMAKHQGVVNGLMIGVGAAFDYYAGNIKRAPKWMQNNNMEWIYRLLQDPKRLFNRYLYTNTKFIWNAIIYNKHSNEIQKENNKQTVLIVHNYYQIPGGEDIVVDNEKKLLEEHGHKVFLYTRHNIELKTMGKFKKLFLPFTTIFNIKTYKDIRNIIIEKNIDIIHVHNTFNLISPSVYYAALSLKRPVIQTVHNFRLLCPGATFYRNGHICEDCLNKGLKCSLKHKCYRNNLWQTLICVINIKLHRMTGIYRKLNYICLTKFNRDKLLDLNRKEQKTIFNPSKIYIKPNFVYEIKISKSKIRKELFL